MNGAGRNQRRMNTITKVGAALVVALLLLAPASALTPVHAHLMRWIITGLSLAFSIGTVVLTYNTPSTIGGPTLGGTFPPTAIQAQYLNYLTVQISAADSDVSIALVHNWGLSAAQIAAGQPEVHIQPITAGTAAPAFTGFYVGSAANTFTLFKASAAGSGATYLATILRPNTATL